MEPCPKDPCYLRWGLAENDKKRWMTGKNVPGLKALGSPHLPWAAPPQLHSGCGSAPALSQPKPYTVPRASTHPTKTCPGPNRSTALFCLCLVHSWGNRKKSR